MHKSSDVTPFYVEIIRQTNFTIQRVNNIHSLTLGIGMSFIRVNGLNDRDPTLLQLGLVEDQLVNHSKSWLEMMHCPESNLIENQNNVVLFDNRGIQRLEQSFVQNGTNPIRLFFL